MHERPEVAVNRIRLGRLLPELSGHIFFIFLGRFEAFGKELSLKHVRCLIHAVIVGHIVEVALRQRGMALLQGLMVVHLHLSGTVGLCPVGHEIDVGASGNLCFSTTTLMCHEFVLHPHIVAHP